MEISAELQVLFEALRQEVAELRQQLAAREATILELKQEVAELRRQLGKDSSNSSKPPSSDGFKKKPRIAGSLRGISGKKSGGQAGHKGDTLRQVETPDKIERHDAKACAHCAARLSAKMVTGVEKRQLFDMPEPRLEVTEHHAGLHMPMLSRHHKSSLSGRGGVARSVRTPRQGDGGIFEREATDPRRSRCRSHGRFVRCPLALPGEPCGMG